MDKRKAQSPCLLRSACYVNPHWPGLAYQGKMPRLEVQQASWRSVMFQVGPKPEQALAMLCYAEEWLVICQSPGSLGASLGRQVSS